MKSTIALTLLLLPAWATAQTSGRLSAERWTNLPASPSVLSLTDAAIATRAPDTRPMQSGADLQADQTDRFGMRLRGLVTPPVSGTYKFSVAADDAAELWLSPDASRFTKSPVASTRCATGTRQWNKYPSQTSREFTLQAGQSYYIEGLMKENGGADHFSLGWSWQPVNWAQAAHGAVARQSSTRAAGGEAARAIDGDTNGNFSYNSVTHTNSVANSWWEVEFTQLRPLNRVVLWNRTDGWGSRLSNFRVSVLDAVGAEVTGKAFFPPGSGSAGSSVTWDLPATVQGLAEAVEMLKVANAQAKGFRYEVEGAAWLLRNGHDVVRLTKKVAVDLGRTDIDVVVRDGAEIVYYQMKRSRNAFISGSRNVDEALDKAKAWVAKALADLPPGADYNNIRYATDASVTVPQKILDWFSCLNPSIIVERIPHLD